MLQPSTGLEKTKNPLKPSYPQKDIWDVQVTWMDSMEAIYVRFTDNTELRKITTDLNEFYKNKKLPPIKTLTLGDVCLLSNAGKFFRAQIQSCTFGIFNFHSLQGEQVKVGKNMNWGQFIIEFSE